MDCYASRAIRFFILHNDVINGCRLVKKASQNFEATHEVLACRERNIVSFVKTLGNFRYFYILIICIYEQLEHW